VKRAHVEGGTQLGLLLLTVISACTDPPEPAWRLDRPRVLGAEVAPVADSRRASLTPGERVRVDIVTASRALAKEAFPSHALRICPADPNTSIFACRGADLRFDESGSIDPRLTFDAPTAPGPLLVFGIMCSGSSVKVDANTLVGTCDGEGQELAIRIEVGGPANAQPAFDEGSARVGSTALLANDDCQGNTLAADGRKYALSIQLAPGSREDGDDPIVSHLATHGDLERLYSQPDEQGVFRVDWTAPSSLGAPREAARFHFVLRDGRGGTTFLTRSLCLSKGA
jgi:hypothetical protein